MNRRELLGMATGGLLIGSAAAASANTSTERLVHVHREVFMDGLRAVVHLDMSTFRSYGIGYSKVDPTQADNDVPSKFTKICFDEWGRPQANRNLYRGNVLVMKEYVHGVFTREVTYILRDRAALSYTILSTQNSDVSTVKIG